MDAKEFLTKVRVNIIVVSIAIFFSIGFFFYGLINSIQAQKNKELALRKFKRM